MSTKRARVGIPTMMNVKDLPEPIAAVPGTAAYDYISGRKKVCELGTDPRLEMSLDPQDGQPGHLYVQGPQLPVNQRPRLCHGDEGAKRDRPDAAPVLILLTQGGGSLFDFHVLCREPSRQGPPQST